MQWTYAYRFINYLDPATGGDLGGYRAGVSDSLIGDTRDSLTDPHRGLFWTVILEPNLKVLGSDKDYLRLYGQVFAYVPLGSKLVWAQGLRVGSVPGDDVRRGTSRRRRLPLLCDRSLFLLSPDALWLRRGGGEELRRRWSSLFE